MFVDCYIQFCISPDFYLYYYYQQKKYISDVWFNKQLNGLDFLYNDMLSTIDQKVSKENVFFENLCAPVRKERDALSFTA